MVKFTNFAVFAVAVFAPYVAGAPLDMGGESHAADTHGQIIQGSYIVSLKPGFKAADFSSHIEWINDIHNKSSSKKNVKGVERTYTGEFDFHGYAGSFDDNTIAEIRKHPDVAVVEDDTICELSYIQERGPRAGLEKKALTIQSGATWGLGAISHRQPGSTDYIYDTATGYRTYAYVVDSGCRVTHEEFEGRASHLYTAIPGDNEDSIGHGTHVAGTIAGKTYGVAKNARILAVKVFQGPNAPTSVIIDGFIFAANDIIKSRRTKLSVVNMSLASPKSPAFNEAVDKATSYGVLSVIAAGNAAQDANQFSPASAPSGLTVAALDPDWSMAYYSNYGAAVDIYGPGTNITSAWPLSDTSINTISGTSMASPHIAGLALNAISLGKGYVANDIISYLKNTATKGAVVGPTGGSPDLIGNNNNSEQPE